MKNKSCETCGFAFKLKDYSRLHYHHVRPKQHGGDDSDKNKILLCPNCHSTAHILLREALNNNTIYDLYERDNLVTAIRNYLIESGNEINLSTHKREPLRAKLLKSIGSILLGIKTENGIEMRIRRKIDRVPDDEIDKIAETRREIINQIRQRSTEIKEQTLMEERAEARRKELDKQIDILMKTGLFKSRIDAERSIIKL